MKLWIITSFVISLYVGCFVYSPIAYLVAGLIIIWLAIQAAKTEIRKRPSQSKNN